MPNPNFNLGLLIGRGTKVERNWNYDGSRCSSANTMYLTMKRPCVPALRGRFMICRGLSNRSLTQALPFCSESFHVVERHVKALSHSCNRLLIFVITAALQFQPSNGPVLTGLQQYACELCSKNRTFAPKTPFIYEWNL